MEVHGAPLQFNKALLTGLLFFVTGFANAQNEFRNGFVVTNSRDTLYGLIDYGEGSTMHKLCLFKASKGKKATVYKPDEILGYGFVNDKVYESRQVNIFKQKTEQVFTEVIIRGYISLFKYNDQFFVQKQDSSFLHLKNESRKINYQGKIAIRKTNEHIAILNLLMFDCPELRDEIQKVKLTEKVLTLLVEKYNACKDVPGIAYKTQKPWIKPTIGLNVGYNSSVLSIVYPPWYYSYERKQFEVSKAPLFGISLDLSNP